VDWERRLVSVAGMRATVFYNTCTYPPSNDTVLALKVLEKAYYSNLRPRNVLDIGTGSGVLALASYLLFKPARLVATDVSPYAIISARKTLEYTNALVVRCNLASCTRGLWDLVIANPPYLPVEDNWSGCEGFERLEWGSPNILPLLCDTLSSISRYVIVVYSSLSPVDFLECLGSRGFTLVFKAEAHYFMEKIIAVLMERR
jgi:release factor glutamine methyltransferase